MTSMHTRSWLADGNTYFAKIVDAVVLDAHFDATDQYDLADWLAQLSAHVRSGSVHSYKEDLIAEAVEDRFWSPADWQTARVGATVRHKDRRIKGKIVGVRAMNAVYVRWDGYNGMGMGDQVDMSVLEVEARG